MAFYVFFCYPWSGEFRPTSPDDMPATFDHLDPLGEETDSWKRFPTLEEARAAAREFNSRAELDTNEPWPGLPLSWAVVTKASEGEAVWCWPSFSDGTWSGHPTRILEVVQPDAVLVGEFNQNANHTLWQVIGSDGCSLGFMDNERVARIFADGYQGTHGTAHVEEVTVAVLERHAAKAGAA